MQVKQINKYRLQKLFQYSILLFQLYSTMAIGQCPVADFMIDADACEQENILIENTSINGTKYDWDFCVGDLANDPGIATTVLTDLVLNRCMTIDIVVDGGNFYGFTVDRIDRKLLRLDFGNDISNTPVIQDFGKLGDVFDQTWSFKIQKEGLNWYGFASNKGAPASLVRLSFGQDITSIPTSEKLSHDGLLASNSVTPVIDDGKALLFLSSDSNNLQVVDFGNSFANNISTVTVHSISGGGTIYDLTLIKDCDQWYAYFVNYTGTDVFKLEFGDDLLSVPVSTKIINDIGSHVPSIELVQDNEQFYILISSTTNSPNVYKVDLGNDLSVNNQTITTYGSLWSDVNVFGLEVLKNKSEWYLFGLDYTSNVLLRTTFPHNCSVINPISNLEQPEAFNYVIDGTYSIGLEVQDDNGNIDYISKDIIINNVEAPQINIQISESRCIGVQNTLTGELVSAHNITDWDWYIDDIFMANGSELQHEFDQAKEYEIRLEVAADNGCGNQIARTITIYEEPIPDFQLSASPICILNTVEFENLTTGENGEIVQWEWNFGDGSPVVTTFEATHTYTTPGNYTVTLKATIPGCETQVQQQVEVIEVSPANFDFINSCHSAGVQFSNLTSGDDIVGQLWEFGDGNSYTQLEPPIYYYQQPGDYEVTLTVFNDLGCENKLAKEITVYEDPEVYFTYELPCSGDSIQFFDETELSNSNFKSWYWDFGDGTTQNLQSPIHAYELPGIYDVKLVVITNFDCKDSTIVQIEVLETPAIDIDIKIACLGDSTYFSPVVDTASVAIGTPYYWEINDEPFTINSPAVLFDEPGTYHAELFVHFKNGCSAQTTKEFIIPSVPRADFEVQNTCISTPIKFTSTSSSPDDPVQSYFWDFGTLGTSELPSPEVSFLSAGEYEVKLEVTTEKGCADLITKTVEVFENPTASFVPSIQSGAPPLSVQFDNQSTGATSYYWTFDVNGINSSADTSPTYEYVEIGEYLVTLVAYNDQGCTDTTKYTISILPTIFNYTITNISTLEQQDYLYVLITIKNNGTVIADTLHLDLSIGRLINIRESVFAQVAPGEIFNVPISTAFQRYNADFSHLCALLEVPHESQTETDLTDNYICENLDHLYTILPPYPNPTSNSLFIDLIANQVGQVRFELISMKGEKVYSGPEQDVASGYNSFGINMKYDPGVYLLHIYFNNNLHTYRVVVN